jgi:hypothetical protein
VAREIKAPPAKVQVARSFDNKHVIEFSEGTHRYKLDGKQCCGVTTFCKGGYPTSAGLISWQKGQALEHLWNAVVNQHTDLETKPELFKAAKAADRAVSQEAADIGTLIHEWAFLYETKGDIPALDAAINGLDAEPKIKVWRGIEKFKAWRSTVDDRLQSVEQLVASPTHLYCGKFDKLAYRRGKLILGDYKSSKSIYLEMFVQLGAYAIAIEEWLGLRVEGLEILRFGKEDGEFETMLVDKSEEIAEFKRQAIRSRETYEFTKLNSDPRWKYVAKA